MSQNRQPRYVFAFDERAAVGAADARERLGGKGANLGIMTTELALPVPPGFTISTAACRAGEAYIPGEYRYLFEQDEPFIQNICSFRVYFP